MNIFVIQCYINKTKLNLNFALYTVNYNQKYYTLFFSNNR